MTVIWRSRPLSRHVRAIRIGAAVLAVSWLGVVEGAASAQADPNDDRFVDAVATLGIQSDPDALPATGRRICDMLTSGLKGNVNPLPTVRGVRDMLQRSNGLTRAQASGLLQASVAVYCPEHTAITGR